MRNLSKRSVAAVCDRRDFEGIFACQQRSQTAATNQDVFAKACYELCQNAIILDLTNFRHVPFCLFQAETEFLIHGGAEIQFS
jgi:hypothetical protein